MQQAVLSDAAPTILSMATNWTYVLRVRTRWAGDPDMREYFEVREAIADLGKLGIQAEDFVQRLALFKHIEVELHKMGPERRLCWPEIVDAASEIPWEYRSARPRAAQAVSSCCWLRVVYPTIPAQA